MTVGERIKKRRKELGLSVDEVAKCLGKDRSTVYRYESNDIEKLPTTILEPLAQVLKIDPAYFMTVNEKNAPDNIKDVVEMLPNGISINSFNSMLNDMTDTDIDSLLDFARYLRWKHNQVQ